jgi:uncharacterized protein (DUF1697 family)
MPSAYVALLRGVNVGGKNKLPMKDLVGIFEATGCLKVRNYIQSGNIIFHAPAALAKRVPGLVGAEVERKFGFLARMVLRTASELRQVAGNNPFLKKGAEERLLSVMFLADRPGPEAIAKLDLQKSSPDEFVVSGDTIFLHTPAGLADTKLTNAYFDSRLKTFSTARNWRTTLKLLEMMGG